MTNETVPVDPMVRVEALAKRYGRRVALDGISFTVGRGEIVGFLGPNGAGKTTTMRILSGFLPPTAGQAAIAGWDVGTDSLEVRRRIGYLPENCPLYPDMRVNEYLKFRARIKGLHGRRRRDRVRDVKDLCGLGEVGRRILGHLSKGFRQRVGLADALLHEPDLLILDEPTIGLDPNQIRQMRRLIKDLAGRHTVLLSSHILPEVEATCERVLIIDRGRIVASDTPAMLKEIARDKAHIEAEISGPRTEVIEALRDLTGVRSVEAVPVGPWVSVTISGEARFDLRDAVFDLVVAKGWKLRELRLAERSLEDVFEALTAGEEGAAAA